MRVRRRGIYASRRRQGSRALRSGDSRESQEPRRRARRRARRVRHARRGLVQREAPRSVRQALHPAPQGERRDERHGERVGGRRRRARVGARRHRHRYPHGAEAPRRARASLIIGDALAPTFIADGAKGVEDVLYRREYVAAIFKELRAKGKKDAKAYAADGGVDVKGLLAGDPEFDSPLAEFLEKNGLKELA